MLLFFFVSFCIVGLILLQEGKGGGLAAMGGGSMDSVMGVRNPLRRWTAYLSVAFLVLALGINVSISRKGLRAPPKAIEEEALPVPPAAPAVTPPLVPAGDAKPEAQKPEAAPVAPAAPEATPIAAPAAPAAAAPAPAAPAAVAPTSATPAVAIPAASPAAPAPASTEGAAAPK